MIYGMSGIMIYGIIDSKAIASEVKLQKTFFAPLRAASLIFLAALSLHKIWPEAELLFAIC